MNPLGLNEVELRDRWQNSAWSGTSVPQLMQCVGVPELLKHSARPHIHPLGGAPGEIRAPEAPRHPQSLSRAHRTFTYGKDLMLFQLAILIIMTIFRS